nr:MAG TPA: hypothetical protein [Caudoviricetes sp.]
MRCFSTIRAEVGRAFCCGSLRLKHHTRLR